MESYSGNCYRVISLAVQNGFTLSGSGNSLDGEGASLRGGRCNLRGTCTAYLSQDLPTALRESLGARDLYRIKRFKPMVIQTACLITDCIVDLAEPAVRRRNGVTLKDLRVAWFGKSEPTRLQNVCAQLAADGVKAIRFPSTRSEGYNFAIFVENLEEHDVLRVYADDASQEPAP